MEPGSEARPSERAKSPPPPQFDPIRTIHVEGFKSLAHGVDLDIRPLTIIAGANSSGKSSAIQPLLLLKQTVDAAYDPGVLLLNGSNTKVRNARDLISVDSANECAGPEDCFLAGLSFESGRSAKYRFRAPVGGSVELESIEVVDPFAKLPKYQLSPGLEEAAVRRNFESNFPKSILGDSNSDANEQWELVPERFFLQPQVTVDNSSYRFTMSSSLDALVQIALTRCIHLPGLRGNPERSYMRSAHGPDFPGQFQDYTASIVSHWQQTRDPKLGAVSGELQMLGLTWKVKADPVDDTRIELSVGRLPRARQGGAHDVVSIADVGLGVSQILPVVVALHVAEPGQTVLIEQPEIHLHPRAQALLASTLVSAAKRGVTLVVETHSSILLRSIQTKVASQELNPADVAMHWFTRDSASGNTSVSSTLIEGDGSFGDWPADFDSVQLDVEDEYFTAVTDHISQT